MPKIADIQLRQLIEAALFVADAPLSKDRLQDTVLEGLGVSKKRLDEALKTLQLDYQARGIQLVEVASGFRFQSMDSLSPWLSKLWQEQAPRYSRAMLETLALVAYRQPITRGEIEDVRGVSVSSHIIRTLTEREWIKVVGHKEVPGRPALYGTTKAFLDYFSLRSLSDLPPMEELNDLAEQMNAQAESALTGSASHSIEKSEEQSASVPGANNEQLH